jgi:hypothetical protein
VESFSTFSGLVALYASSRYGGFEGLRGGQKFQERTIMQERQRSSARSARLGKRLDPDLKSWLDNVIVPALVREYLAEIKQQNRLATTGPSEVTCDKGR